MDVTTAPTASAVCPAPENAPAPKRPIVQAPAGRWGVSRPTLRPPPSVDASHARDTEPAALRVNCPDDGLSAFLSVRPRLLAIAHRILGSAADAEDVVQDAWVRWQTADRSVVREVPAFLATTTTRLAINVIQSARSRRERYAGRWMPDPVDTDAGPGSVAQQSEALELAVLILLQKLSPTERAAYVLREAFDYRYREIADLLRLEEANARQLVTRARQHVAGGRRVPVGSAEQRRLVNAFTSAAEGGDVAGLEDLFASDVESQEGERPRARRPTAEAREVKTSRPARAVRSARARRLSPGS